MKTRTKLLMFAIFVAACVIIALAIFTIKWSPVSSQAQNVFKQMFSNDYSTYKFRDAPVGNFGAGTLYDNTLPLSTNGNISQNMLLATLDGMFREGITEEQKNEEEKKLIQIGSLGASSLTQVDASRISLEAIAPGFSKVFGFNAKSENKSILRIYVSATGAQERKFAWNEFRKAIHAGLIDEGIVKRFKAANIAIVASDLTLLNYSIRIDFDGQRDQTLKDTIAKNNGTNVQGTMGTSFAIKQTSSSSFELVASQPVVIAQQFVCLNGATAFDLPELPLPTNTLPVGELSLKSAELANLKIDPVLTSAAVEFDTLDDDKDNDTRLSVLLLLDKITVAENRNIAPNIRFPDQSHNGPFPLQISKPIPANSAAACKLLISVRPNGNDIWHFNASVVLTFSDGSRKIINTFETLTE